MADRFSKYYAHLDDPAENGAAVTPSDTVDLPTASRFIWVGGAGNIALITVGGDTITLNGCLAGTMLRVRASRILATGTTATNLVALW